MRLVPLESGCFNFGCQFETVIGRAPICASVLAVPYA